MLRERTSGSGMVLYLALLGFLYFLQMMKISGIYSGNSSDKSNNTLQEFPGSTQCSQLWNAHKHVFSHTGHIKESRVVVSMLQLVGVWPNNSRETQVFQQVFSHNERLLKRHGINSSSVTSALDSPTVIRRDLSPAYWKMNATLSACQNNSEMFRQNENTDHIILFMDGDAMIMDPYARFDALWVYMASEIDTMDFLFAQDAGAGINSGLWMVNCSSSFALDFLRVWDVVARDLHATDVVVKADWYEQNALHHMLQTDTWIKATSSYSQSGLWNAGRHGLDSSKFSTDAIKRRIALTQQCSFNSYPLTKPRRQRLSSTSVRSGVIYNPGQFVLHGAGLSVKRKVCLFEKLLENETLAANYQYKENTIGLERSASAYLASHAAPYEYIDPPILGKNTC